MEGSEVDDVSGPRWSGVSNQDFGGRWDCASFDREDSSVSKSHWGSKDILSSANVSKLTSEGFLRLMKWAGIPGRGPSDQAGGGFGSDGVGGVREGKVTGTGLEGGGLSFLQSCWPARRPPTWRNLYQQTITQVHGAPFGETWMVGLEGTAARNKRIRRKTYEDDA